MQRFVFQMTLALALIFVGIWSTSAAFAEKPNWVDGKKKMENPTNRKQGAKGTGARGTMTTGIPIVENLTREMGVETRGTGTSINKNRCSSTNIIPVNFDRGAARRALSRRATAAYPAVMQKCGKKADRFPGKSFFTIFRQKSLCSWGLLRQGIVLFGWPRTSC